MVLDWLHQAMFVAACETPGQASHEDVVWVLLRDTMVCFDHGPPAYAPALNCSVTGLGTVLSNDATWKLTESYRAKVTHHEAKWIRTLEILSWLGHVKGYKLGAKRLTLAGMLRGYPNDTLKRLLSPGDKVTSRAVQLLRTRALKDIVDGVCSTYGIERHGACEFRRAHPSSRG